MLAFGAVAASSAYAGEYGVCVQAGKVAVKYKSGEKEKSKKITEGRFLDKNCTEYAPEPGKYYSGPEGKYEWSPYPGPAGTGWEYTEKAAHSTLSTDEGSITCAKNTAAGLVTGAKTGEDALTFEDCTNSVFGTNCYNVEATKEGKKGGTIDLKSDTKLIDHGEKGGSGDEPEEGEVWDEYLPTGELGPYLAVFYCKTPLGEDPFAVSGSISGVQAGDVNVMSTKFTVDAGAGIGEQDLITNTASDEPPYEEVHLASSFESGNGGRSERVMVAAPTYSCTKVEPGEGNYVTATYNPRTERYDCVTAGAGEWLRKPIN
jgi:hypothetical protein